jgi:hypothetical protein
MTPVLTAASPAPVRPRAPQAPAGAAAMTSLTLLGEPTEILSELRGLAADRPATARALAPGMLAGFASMIWQDELADIGIPTNVVSAVFESCRREIWLWFEGDRRWGQLSSHLSARVLRRARIV